MMHIRPATEADAPAIADLIAALAHLFFASPDGSGSEAFSASTTPAALAAFIARADVIYLVREEKGQLCGAVGVVRASQKAPHLHHLFVAPQFQGRGMGRQLWLAAQHAAWPSVQPGEAAGGFTVNASLNAIAFYQRIGFETVGAIARANGLIFQPMQLQAR